MEEASVKDEWPVTAKRYVAYFDIMGFKDMVSRVSHDEIYDMMKNIDLKVKFNVGVKWKNIKSGLVKTTNYSDSIIIYSMDDSYDSLSAFICTVSSLTNDLLIDAIPHKGAAAFGVMTLDTVNSIFFGQPLIDAYLLQEELNFYGIVVHATLEQEIGIKEQTSALPFQMKYLCNFKNGNAVHVTINPIYVFCYQPDLMSNTDALFASTNKLRLKTSGYLRKYIDNTEMYLNTVNKEWAHRTKIVKNKQSLDPTVVVKEIT